MSTNTIGNSLRRLKSERDYFHPITWLVFSIFLLGRPLYTSNQNTYFIHGEAQGRLRGVLAHDFMASTSDPCFVFSKLISVLSAHHVIAACYVIYVLIGFTYLLSLLHITHHVTEGHRLSLDEKGRRLLCCWIATVVVTIHVLPWPVVQRLFHWGIADQYLLIGYLQPSTFGVLIVTGISLFLRKHFFYATICICFAALFHPTYTYQIALLFTLFSYAEYMRTRKLRDLLHSALVFLAFIFPLSLYVYVNFRHTDPTTFHIATDILVNQRIQHHASVHELINANSAYKVAIIGLALWLIRKHPSFVIFAAPAFLSFLLSLLCAIVDIPSLALLFPWRITVWLFPIAVMIVISIGATELLRVSSRSVWLQRFTSNRLALGILCVALCTSGYVKTTQWIQAVDPATERMRRLLEGHRDPDRVVLVPPEWEQVRLNAAVPIFIDFKSHPYRDVEVIEWHRRIQIARAFYDAENNEERCHALSLALETDSHLARVVTRAEEPLNCHGADVIARDGSWLLCELDRGSSAETRDEEELSSPVVLP